MDERRKKDTRGIKNGQPYDPGLKTFDSESLESDFFLDAGEDKKDRWSISWSDLMMTMFVLFTVLYVYQAGNRELRFGSGPGGNEVTEKGGGKVLEANVFSNPSDIYDYARQAIREEFTNVAASVDMVSDDAVRISIAGDILFDTGRAELRPEARDRLLQIAGILRDNTYTINVVGHTDSMPNHSLKYPTNWELSAARATTTARFLIETAGIEASRFFISAHAWHQPVKPNSNPINRRVNRRVEIILTKERPYLNTGF